MTEYADAEAVFGSASRGDGDLLSDRDILIVDSDTSLLGRRRAVLESEGWSVASYTYRKLAVLAGKGVLFLEHLRAESTILRDSNHRLRTILNASIPKQSYEKDIAENARLAHLITSYPDCRMGVLWAADVLFVATRNFGILSLAQTGRYIFSYPKVLEALAEESVLPVAGISPLLDLRVAKASYRADLCFCGNADTIVNRALAVLPQRWFPRTSIPVSPRRTIAEAGELPLGAYHRLRHLERAYLSLVERWSRFFGQGCKWISAGAI